jgi:hypothetical protein
MMKIQAPAVRARAALAKPGTRMTTVLFELSADEGHGNGTSGKI